jgi:2-polyprenyl-3-methyl-5-hydroxy-6-metoxy-1,4-benzoquinol methylase
VTKYAGVHRQGCVISGRVASGKQANDFLENLRFDLSDIHRAASTRGPLPMISRKACHQQDNAYSTILLEFGRPPLVLFSIGITVIPTLVILDIGAAGGAVSSPFHSFSALLWTSDENTCQNRAGGA